MRVSPLGLRHFYHRIDCDAWRPESILHMEMKAAAFEEFKKAGWNVDLEVRGDGWIADVLAKKRSRTVVIEIQISRIPLEEYYVRSEKYREAGFEDYWVFFGSAEGLGEKCGKPAYTYQEIIVNIPRLLEMQSNLTDNLIRYFKFSSSYEPRLWETVTPIQGWIFHTYRHFSNDCYNLHLRYPHQTTGHTTMPMVPLSEYRIFPMPIPSIQYQSLLFKWQGAHLNVDERFHRDCRLQTQWEIDRGLWKES